MEETVEMSIKELERIKVLSQVREGKMTQALAAKSLNISDRQVRKLLSRLEVGGDIAIISKKRGKPSNNRLPFEIKEKALSLARDHYVDFGPKLTMEYLQKEHALCISKETLRKWMIECHLWIPRRQGKGKLHPPRERRRAFGELVQVDGSHHDWFEGRSPPCCLMVFIDDATSAITSLHFSKGEDFEAYAKGFSKHLENYGIPLSLYGDRCSVLTPREQTPTGITQFHKSLKELNCELILARSPQAKGRVERANRTLQDRLVKMLRIRGVNTIDQANEVLEEYQQEHNRYFSKKPDEHQNAHRPLDGICLQNVFSIREIRTLDKDFVIQFENTFYQISAQSNNIRLYKRGKIEIRKQLDGIRRAFFLGKEVKMTSLRIEASPVIDSKILMSWDLKHQYKTPMSHPYKQSCFRKRIIRKKVQAFG